MATPADARIGELEQMRSLALRDLDDARKENARLELSLTLARLDSQDACRLKDENETLRERVAELERKCELLSVSPVLPAVSVKHQENLVRQAEEWQRMASTIAELQAVNSDLFEQVRQLTKENKALSRSPLLTAWEPRPAPPAVTPSVPTKNRNKSDELGEIGKMVLYALNNSGHVPPSFSHRAVVERVLLDLRLFHGITPDTPPGDPDFELPLIVRLVQKHHSPPANDHEPPVTKALNRSSFDPVADQAYNLWTSLLFMARLISAFSAIVAAVWLFRILIMGERGGWPIVGTAALILLCSRIAVFFFTAQALRRKENHDTHPTRPRP
jgi:hypothetical protein